MSKSKQPSRRLPGGGETRDVDEYLNSWHALAEPLEETFGWKLVAFDPGCIFERHRDRTIERIDLPTAVVREMAEKLNEVYRAGVRVGLESCRD